MNDLLRCPIVFRYKQRQTANFESLHPLLAIHLWFITLFYPDNLRYFQSFSVAWSRKKTQIYWMCNRYRQNSSVFMLNYLTIHMYSSGLIMQWKSGNFCKLSDLGLWPSSCSMHVSFISKRQGCRKNGMSSIRPIWGLLRCYCRTDYEPTETLQDLQVGGQPRCTRQLRLIHSTWTQLNWTELRFANSSSRTVWTAALVYMCPKVTEHQPF